jgi:NADH-quinone oxidoreductase subunit L
VISAMAGDQNLDRMGGFRKAMPFTFGCFIVGGLALAGVPPFSGFFSKDDILASVGSEGGWHVILAVLGYIVAFMTAVYTFRMIFRAFLNDPVPEARELEEGHLHHADVPTNPASGEVEDTDVGFPGPGHHIAEREPSMKIAMTGLAILTVIGGFLQIPWVDNVLENFLEPTFAGSVYFETVHASNALTAFGLVIGTIIALTGIGVAYFIWVMNPGTSERIRLRVKPLYTFSFNKWYFDEIIDFLIVRPAKRAGGIAGSVVERGFIDKGITGGANGAVKVGSTAVRAVQTGYLRYYAALIVVGMVAVTAWFLIQS